VYLLFALSALFGIITFYQQRVDTLMQENAESQQTLKLLYEGEIALRGQIQEFKNILLRGHNSEDKDHYYQAFLKNSQNFKEKIKQVAYLVHSVYPQESHLHAQLTLLQKTHDDLNEAYLKAYALLGDANYEKKMLADRQVRGADRNLPPLFDALRTSLKKSDTALHFRNNSSLKDYTLAIAVMLLFIVATSLYIYYTTRKISESKNMLDTMLDRSYVMSREMSDEIARKQQLEESEERYRTFVELSSDMLFLKDDAFRYIIINKNFATFFAKEESEIIGKTDYDLMTHESAKLCRLSDSHTLSQGGKTVSEEQVGERIYETTKYPMQFLKKTYLAGVIKDITELRQARAKGHL